MVGAGSRDVVMTDNIRIGFVGVGGMGQCAHLKNYVTIPDCGVVAIAEIRPDLAEKVAARYNVPKVYASHLEMLEKEELDGIVASQPFNRHGILVPDLLKVGVPIFTEKPLAGSVAVGRKILDAVERSGTWLMVGYHKRSDPATMYAKREIDRLKESGELGKMTYVRVLMPAGDWIAGGFNDRIEANDPAPELDCDPPPEDMDEVTSREYDSLVNYYIHQVNLLRHLLGESYGVRHADPSGVLFVAESRSGVPGVIEMTPYRTSIDWQESALVCFERGYVKITLPAPLVLNRPGQVEIFRDPRDGAAPQMIRPQLPWIHAMRQQAMNFIAAIRGEMEPPCEAAEALEDLRVARAYIRLLRGK